MIKFQDYNFKGKKAIIRVDFNVPLNAEKQITDDTRIRMALPTIEKIIADGGAVVLMSHLGRPKGGPEEKYSMKPLVSYLTKALSREVKFAEDCIGDETLSLKKNLKAGDILLLNNLRFYKEEEKGSKEFAQKLAEGVDVYVNDAFGTAHRAHASTTIIADFFPNDKMFGYLLAQEVESMNKVLKEGEKPITAILGGAKVSSKISVIENMLDKVNNIIIGGGMTYTFVKAQGGNIGSSLVEDDYLETAKNVLAAAKQKGVNIYLPIDSLNADKFDNAANTSVSDIDKVPDGMMGLDISDKTIALFKDIILKSKTILWNGPMGVFEMENFAKGTIAIANALVEATKNGSFTLVGGGDSVAAINQFNLADQVSYVSTGGGAMLEYIEGKVLPGVAAILD
jgi:phosphoglycerate kinase